MAAIKLVQSGTISFLAADSTKTATITAIVTSKSILFFTLSGNTSSESRDNIVRGEITNSTTLSFIRNYARNTVQVEWFLVEFISGVSSQQGYQASLGATVNVTITSVNTSKSWSCLSQDDDSFGFNDAGIISHYISSATNLRMQHSSACPPLCNVTWQVIELENASVQQVSKALGAGDTSATSTITSVTTGKTFLRFSYRADSSTSSNEPRYCWICDLTNSTTITYSRDTSNQAYDAITYVISIAGAVSVQRGKKSFAIGDTSLTGTITAVALARTHVHSLNFEGIVLNSNDDGDSYYADIAGIKIKFNSTTQLSFIRNTSGYTATASWEAVEWPMRVFDFAPFFM